MQKYGAVPLLLLYNTDGCEEFVKKGMSCGK
jgi:hypothetical protein